MPHLWQVPDVWQMNDTLPAEFQAISPNCLYSLSVWAMTLPDLERPGAHATINRIWRLRDPQIARTMAEQVEKQAKKGKA